MQKRGQKGEVGKIFTTLHNVKAREEAWRGKRKIVGTELNKMVKIMMQGCADLQIIQGKS